MHWGYHYVVGLVRRLLWWWEVTTRSRWKLCGNGSFRHFRSSEKREPCSHEVNFHPYPLFIQPIQNQVTLYLLSHYRKEEITIAVNLCKEKLRLLSDSDEKVWVNNQILITSVWPLKEERTLRQGYLDKLIQLGLEKQTIDDEDGEKEEVELFIHSIDSIFPLRSFAYVVIHSSFNLFEEGIRPVKCVWLPFGN